MATLPHPPPGPPPPINLDPPLTGIETVDVNNPGVTGLNQALQKGPGVKGGSLSFEVLGELAPSLTDDKTQGEQGTPPIAPAGVWGQEKKIGDGVFGNSVNHDGVVGDSVNGRGVVGTTHNPNVAAVFGRGTIAGDFEGNVVINGVPFQFPFPALIVRSPPAAKAARFEGDVEVSGDLNVGDAQFIGDVVVTGDVKLTNKDCSELFDITGAENCAPGTVVTIDDAGTLVPSRREYDTCVAGVVSGAGNLRPA